MKHILHLFIISVSTIQLVNADYTDAQLGGHFEFASTHDAQSYVTVWGKGYATTANKAYSCDGNHKVPLSTLFFGKSCFTLSQAFANAIVIKPSNPWINVSTLCPIIEYTDKGAYFGLEYARDVQVRSHHMRVGMRGYIPVKSVAITRQYTSQDVESEITNLNTVRALSSELVTGTEGQSIVDNSFAYRLDFLSSLLTNDQGTLLIDYSTVPLTMNGNDVTDSGNSSINIIKRSNALVPSTPYAAPTTTVDSSPFVEADGSGLSDNERGRFAHETSYESLSTDLTNQSQLWVVPTVEWNGSAYNLATDANTLRGIVENQINYQIDNSIIDYFTSKNINLASQQSSGLGDLNTQLFMAWSWPDTMAWTELNCSFVFPTGKKQNNPLIVFAYPLGNNGHVEIAPGIDIGWYALRWLSLHAQAQYFWVLRANECVAAPFTGACVKNIGPSIPATIAWQYFNLVVDANIIEPHYHHFGFNIGYNFYFKKADTVVLHSTTAQDFEGVDQELDACVLSRLTRVITHKIVGELFFTGSLGSIFGGFSYVVRGKNSPIQMAAYAGLVIEF